MVTGACRALAAVLLALATLPLAGAPAVAEDAALRETSTSTYVVRPPGGRILVRVRLRLENPGIERSARNWGPILVEDEATRIRVTTDPGTVQPTVTDLPGPWQRVDLRINRIPPGQSRSFLLEYTLSGGAPQSSDPFRLGPAYAWFCVTGQDTDRGSVTVRLPREHVPTYSGVLLAQVENGPAGTLTSGASDDPLSLFTCLTGTVVEGLVQESLKGPDDRELLLQAWPEDARWLTPARTFSERALPQLRATIGHPIPGSEPVVVRQSPPRDIGGYAGAHDHEGLVQLSETVNPTTIDHELAHAWFGASLFPETWSREGLALWTAATIARRPCTEPAGGAAGLDLDDWQVVRPTSPEDIEALIARQEQAACWITSSLAERMGEDQMRTVLGSLLKEEEKYVGNQPPGPSTAGLVDWREWLDAMDERGLVPAGVEDLDIASSLLAEHGVADDAALLAQRSEARRTYHALLARAAPLAAPSVVRTAMDEWRFADAVTALALASEVLDALSVSDDLLPEAGLVSILQPRFEGAADLAALEAVKSEAAALLEQADAIVGPLNALRSAAAAWSWKDPAVVIAAVTAGRFDEARAALVPALAIVEDLAAAEVALPDADIHSAYRARFESMATVATLEGLAESVAAVREQAETTSRELSALNAEAGEWTLPAAVTAPLSGGQVAAALAAIRDARSVIQSTTEARAALPEADVPAVVRPAYEAADTGTAMRAVALQAAELRDAAVATGSALDRLRASVAGWTLPQVFLKPIEERDFATAQEALATGQRWIDFATQADSRLPELGALEAQRAAFEAASSLLELEAGRVVAERQAQAVEYVADALERKNDPRDLLTQIGLLGTDLNAATEAALDAARKGDLAAATAAAATLNKAISDARGAGGLRLAGLVFLGVALLGVIGLLVVLRRERKPPWARTSRPPWAR